MGNPFVYFFNTDQNAPTKILNWNYIVLFKKSAFGSNFGPKLLPKADFLKSTI